MKNEAVAVFVIVLVLVTGTVGVVSWNGNSMAAFASSTTTITQTVSCPTVNSTLTSGNNGNRAPDYGPLLGNLSAISMVENVRSSSGNLSISASLLVLDRNLSSSSPVYLVNVTVKGVSSNVAVVSSNGLTTTTSTISGNQTQMGSVLGLVVSNGSMISLERSTGEPAVTLQLTTFPLEFFGSFVSLNHYTSSYALRAVNSTVVTIGSTRMVVTSYLLPTLVLAQLLEGCGSEPSSVSTVATVSNVVIQAGLVPRTELTLLTLLSERFAFQSNSTSPSLFPARITERVTSFSVG